MAPASGLAVTMPMTGKILNDEILLVGMARIPLVDPSPEFGLTCPAPVQTVQALGKGIHLLGGIERDPPVF